MLTYVNEIRPLTILADVATTVKHINILVTQHYAVTHNAQFTHFTLIFTKLVDKKCYHMVVKR